MKNYTLADFSSVFSEADFLHAGVIDGSLDMSIEYESDFQNTKALRGIIEEICIKFWISSAWRTRFVLAVDELNNNAVEYGSSPWDTNRMHIFVEKRDISTFFRIEVSDAWSWKQHKSAREMQELQEKFAQKDYKEHHSIRGRGLFLIIIQLADRLYFQDCPDWGLTVWFEKELPLNA